MKVTFYVIADTLTESGNGNWNTDKAINSYESWRCTVLPFRVTREAPSEWNTETKNKGSETYV